MCRCRATLYDLLCHLMLAGCDATGAQGQAASKPERIDMTALQILRSILKDGVSLTLCKRADGYNIEVTKLDDAGQALRRAVVHPRLEQALFQILQQSEADGREPLNTQ